MVLSQTGVALKADSCKIAIACIINLLAVSTVFMTQTIFLELSESFKTDITQARLSVGRALDINLQ